MSKKATKPVQAVVAKEKTVGIYILHYQDDETTDQCVTAFDQARVEGQQIVVIDNGSDHHYISIEGVIVHRLDLNLPVVDAWNAGMQAYPADVYLVANNDAMPVFDCVEKLVAALEDESIGIVAAGTSDESVGMMHVPFPGNSYMPNIDMKHVDGHLWGWRHDLVSQIGYPDCEGHTHQMCWGSNRDYCFRARQAGYRVVCVRSAFVDHQRHETYDRAEADAAGHAWIQQKWGELAPLVEA